MKVLILIIDDNLNSYSIQCLKSIFSQSYKNYKVIFSSTTNSLNNYNCDVLDLCNISFKILITKILTNIEFDYIIFYKLDVFSSENRLENQVEFLESNPNFSMVSCLEENNDFNNSISSTKGIDSAFACGYLPLKLSSLLIRRTVLYDLLMVSSLDFLLCNELLILLELMKISRTLKLPKVLIESFNNIPFKEYSDALASYNKGFFIQNRCYLKELIASKPILMDSLISNGISVLMLVDGFDIGGTESYVFSLSKALIKRGYKVFVGCFSGSSLFLLEHNNIPFVVFNREGYFKELEGFVERNNISFIHCHLEESIKLCYYLYMKSKVPYVVTIHGNFYTRECILKHCSKAFAVIFVSNCLVSYYLSELKYVKNYTALSNGIDFCNRIFENKLEDLGISKSQRVITYCSRLDKIKGDIATSVISKLIDVLQKNGNVTLLILGYGFSYNSILSYANKINFALKREAVVLGGCVYDTFSYFNESDVIIGTGRVILEAMSVSKPVICYGLGGMIGIPSDENSRVLVDSNFGDHGDYVFYSDASLSDLVSSLLFSDVSSICSWNYEFVHDNFNVDRIVSELEEKYQF